MTTTQPETRLARNPYGRSFLEYAEQHPDVVALAADTTGVDLAEFRAALPDRFINVGMAEQNLIGIAGGLSRGGLTPFVHTMSTFLTRRAFDQVTLAIGYPRARVRLIGGFAGLNFAGVSHQAIDDVALMRAIPGMTILDLAEATEIGTFLPALTGVDGPVYCRIYRPGLSDTDVPLLFDTPFQLGAARILSQGSDITVVSSSVTTVYALRAAEMLRSAGVGVNHLHIATVRPLDDAAILQAAEATKAVIVVENHLTTGGLGSAVAELLAAHGSGRRLVRLGLADTYAQGGSESFLFARYGLDVSAIVRAAGDLLGLDMPLTEEGSTWPVG